MKRRVQRQLANIIPRTITFLGLGMVAVCMSIEAVNFPWEVYFNAEDDLNQRQLEAPAPIHFDYGDSDILIITPEQAAENPEIYGIEDETGMSALPSNSRPAVSQQRVYVKLGTLKIPKLKLSINIFEGSDKQMWYGAGHITGSALPGQKGNSSIASHRSRYFRHLDLLQAGDIATTEVDGHTYKYEVFEIFDVLPDQTEVLRRVPGEDYVMTLITCTPYPIYSHRMIVRCRLIEIDGAAFVPPQETNAPANNPSPQGEDQPADGSESEPPQSSPEGLGSAD